MPKVKLGTYRSDISVAIKTIICSIYLKLDLGVV